MKSAHPRTAHPDRSLLSALGSLRESRLADLSLGERLCRPARGRPAESAGGGR